MGTNLLKDYKAEQIFLELLWVGEAAPGGIAISCQPQIARDKTIEYETEINLKLRIIKVIILLSKSATRCYH